jgi:hypothetical protein
VRQFLGLGQKKLRRPSQKYFASESPCRYRAALYGQCRELGGARGVPPSLRAPLELLTLRAKSRHKPRFGALNGRRPMRQDTPLKMHVQCSSSPHHSLEPVTWRSNPSFPASNGLYLPPHGLFPRPLLIRRFLRISPSGAPVRPGRLFGQSTPLGARKKKKKKKEKRKRKGGEFGVRECTHI